MSGSNKIIVDSKNNISGEQLEISVKTFFGHKITVIEESGDYKVKSTGIKGLGDKILWFIYAPTLESRKAAVEKSPKNNNSQVPNEKPKLNNWSEQDSLKTTTTSDDLDKTNQSLSEKKSEDDAKKSENSSSERLEQSKNSKKIEPHNDVYEKNSSKIVYDDSTKMANNPYDSNFQLFSNLEDNIKDQPNINGDIKNNSFVKDKESGKQINNEISENSDHRLLNNEFIKKDNDIISENLQSKDHIDDPNKEKTFDDLVNSAIEQVRSNFGLSDEGCNEIRKRINDSVNLGFENPSVIKDTVDQFIKEKYEKEDGNNNINNKLNINNHDRIYKDRVEIENADNHFSLFNEGINDEFSVFKNENNNINSDGENQNSARTDVNNMVHDSSDLSEQELKDLDKEIKDLRLQENEVQSYKKNRIAEIKKDKKENLEYLQQSENIIKQSKSENEDIEKRYKEVENNLKKIIPNGYRITSPYEGDGIIGDGNCFYRAIAKLENENQEGYGEIRKTISDEIDKSAGLAEKSADKIDDNLLYILQIYAGEYNELKDVEIHKNNLDVSLLQIREHVEGKDKQNEYAGPIEAYFYAKATKKVVIIYDSNNQISVFSPDKNGNSVKVEHMAPDKIESYIEKNNIDITAAVKLAYNAVGRHYEAIVRDVEN